jgi:hypothetical protein
MVKSRILLIISLMLRGSVGGQFKPENDKGPDLIGSWPTTMTLRVLEDAGLVDAGQIDPSGTETAQVGSEKVGKNLWSQLYFVRFRLRTGNTVQAIAAVNTSTAADMRSGPVVYVVSKILNPEGKPEPPL